MPSDSPARVGVGSLWNIDCSWGSNGSCHQIHLQGWGWGLSKKQTVVRLELRLKLFSIISSMSSQIWWQYTYVNVEYELDTCCLLFSSIVLHSLDCTVLQSTVYPNPGPFFSQFSRLSQYRFITGPYSNNH